MMIAGAGSDGGRTGIRVRSRWWTNVARVEVALGPLGASNPFGLNHPKSREVAAQIAAINRRNAVGLSLRVCTNEEIWNWMLSGTAFAQVLLEDCAGQLSRFEIGWQRAEMEVAGAQPGGVETWQRS